MVLLRQAREAKPGNALILMNGSTSLYAKGEFEVALSCLRRASVLARDFAPAWFIWAVWIGCRRGFPGGSPRCIARKPRFIDCHAHHWRLCLPCYQQLFAIGENYSVNLDDMV